uniref:CYP450 n=1 Tax=Locusta migratoria TaxID=7004 RepID=A0A6F8GYF5_LOCMI|nr:CYP450 [Locusta migratoria]
MVLAALPVVTLGVAAAAALAVFALVLAVVQRRSHRPAAAAAEQHRDHERPAAPPRPAGPRPLPVLGSLHLLGQHATPFEAFTALAKQYGDIYQLTLGATPCVIVNSYPLIKEVLITKGAHFGGRPDFIRFHKLFGGDRNNSLALCDWSELQKTRRSIARIYCSPRAASAHYDRLEEACAREAAALLARLSACQQQQPQQPQQQALHVKPLLQAACANIFTSYMCSASFDYDDPGFKKMVRTFDEIFWEINQGYAVDFMPWLEPVYRGHMRQISDWAAEIRQFILSRIIESHRRSLDRAQGPRDFTDALLLYLEEDPLLNWEHIIFELEDFLGGHSAIGNLLMLALREIALHPEVGERIRQEADAATGGSRLVSLFDKPSMPFTEATILETLRTASSPIVPHVATQDTSIAGYAVDKGTVVFLNNYELNSGETYWAEPAAFRPERFLSADGSAVVKPEHFIPFSTGKRTCIGQRLVQGCSFVLLAALMQTHTVSAPPSGDMQTFPACVAVPPDTFPLVFSPRQPAE